ncbi:MAG: dihydropyrimidinase [Chloroflexi bacterium]|nr:dihydropyrimidinase [Chloroflexota bacterium]MCL5076020.1 dihydropyrimidinase [Chloroflexota bacterium]
MDTLIRNGLIVTASECYTGDIAIEAGKIVQIGTGLEGADEIIDATGKYVFPGAIDVHVHLEMPSGALVTSDDFFSGTVAAAHGGTTCIIDFATQERGKPLSQAIATRRAVADSKTVIDYALHLEIIEVNERVLAEINELVKSGYPSFKLYMAYEEIMLQQDDLLSVLNQLAESGGIPMVHTENAWYIRQKVRRLLSKGKTATAYHPLSRPPEGEAEAAGRIILAGELVGCPVYIAHVSCSETLAKITAAQHNGLMVFAETCPQYLLLSSACFDEPEPERYVCSPPLRDPSHQEHLWPGLARGNLQVVSTDHCSWWLRGQKDQAENFTQIPGGLPGIETRLPLLYTFGVRTGHLSLNRLAAVTSTNPAKIFGLFPQKGTIMPGSDADLVIFDPHREVRLTAESLHQRVDHNPYAHLTVRGYPSVTLSRGRVIVRDGHFLGEPGMGRFLLRQPFEHGLTLL